VEMRVIRPGDLGDDKLRNIKEMLDKMDEKYRKTNGNLETAKIFGGIKSRKSVGLYNTKACRSVLGDPAKGETHSVKTGEEIDWFIRNNQRGDRFLVTVFHNHRNATTFSLLDVWQMFRYNEIREIFIDSGNEVRYLIKTGSQLYSEADADDMLRQLEDLHSQMFVSRKDDIDIAYAQDESDGGEAMERVLTDIYDKVLGEATVKGILAVCRGAIDKARLSKY